MRSASMAGRGRRPDVYVGVDAFGRGCYGGGGYNCNKVSCISSLVAVDSMMLDTLDMNKSMFLYGYVATILHFE